MLRSYRTPYQNDYSWELVQPGGGLVFVTRQAQSKIDKVLWSSSRAMADILRPFFKITGKKKQNKKKNKNNRHICASTTKKKCVERDGKKTKNKKQEKHCHKHSMNTFLQ